MRTDVDLSQFSVFSFQFSVFSYCSYPYFVPLFRSLSGQTKAPPGKFGAAHNLICFPGMFDLTFPAAALIYLKIKVDKTGRFDGFSVDHHGIEF